MTDYQAYRDHVGISNTDMIRTIKVFFPGYNKVAATFANHPNNYGVCLLPEAEEILVHAYGKGPGLQYPKKKRRTEKRVKCHSVTFRMDEILHQRLLHLKDVLGEPNMQATLERIVNTAFTSLVFKGVANNDSSQNP